jgi:D-alanyl-lipoteichoic acid acyltransferase DltB (MBOAT superfamily)
VASYVFYAFAGWKILFLLILSTAVFYGLGIAIFQAKSDKHKSWLTVSGVVLGIGALFYFKYANFFIASFRDLFESIGLHTNLHTFNIIVPIGISFYTFRLLSYVIDINRGKYEPVQDIITFATYVAFFPTMMSGPIDRPNSFIPQLQSKRVFNHDLAVDGCRQILWGLFKKMVVADNCALFVNGVFDSHDTMNSNVLVISAIFFTIQIYADFSGYSDMAIGIGKILGFRITKNFNYPFFVKNIAEYWRNWHISLTSWLTDYVFMPLNIQFRNTGKWGPILAIIITFILIGLWHGANWTFVAFGLYHGLLYIPFILSGSFLKKSKLKTNRHGFPRLKDAGKMLFTFSLVTFGMVIFRADNIGQAWHYLHNMFSTTLFSFPRELHLGLTPLDGVLDIIFICVLFLTEWRHRERAHGLELRVKQTSIRYFIYLSLLFSIYVFNAGYSANFIYFNF